MLRKNACLILLYVIVRTYTSGQQLYFSQVAVDDSVAFAKAMSALAQKIIANYKQESDQKAYLGNLFMLQMVNK